MKKSLVLFLAGVFTAFGLAQESGAVRPLPRHIDTDAIGAMTQKANDAYFKAHPEAESLLRRQSEKRFANVGDTATFLALNITTSETYSVTATLRAKGTKAQVWVEDSSWGKYADQTVADQLLANLETHSGSLSLDPSKGVLALDTQYFGDPPNVDGDGIVDFLVLDIQDGNNPASFVAGYFTSSDQTGGNHRDMLYLDCYPGITSTGGSVNYSTVLGTAAHELQHLIHYRYHQGGASTWLNECMSQTAVLVCGYKPDDASGYLEEPNNSLTDWNRNDNTAVLWDYQQVQLWGRYLMEQFGSEVMNRIVTDPNTGVTAVDAALAPSGSTLLAAYRQWIVANVVNNLPYGDAYGYSYPYYFSIGANAAAFRTYPADLQNQSVKALAARYYRFTNGSGLKLTFTSASDKCWARLVKLGGNLGFQIVDLPKDTPLEDHSFGTDFTEAIVVVGNDNLYAGTSSIASFSLKAESTAGTNELAWDDGSPSVVIPSSGQSAIYTYGSGSQGKGVAVGFSRPSGAWQLGQVRLEMPYTSPGDENGAKVKLHIYADNAGKPGADLVPPASVGLKLFWNSIDVPALFGRPVMLPETFYIGVTNDSDDTFVGIFLDKSSTPSDHTFRIYPDKDPVSFSGLTLGGQSLAGFNGMIRAVLAPGAVKGDVDGSGQKDLADLLLLARRVVDDTTPGVITEAADLNGDGKLDAADLVIYRDWLTENRLGL